MKDFGQINDRQVKYISTVSDENWASKIPTEKWLAIPFGHTKDVETISKLATICLDKKVSYVCTIGQTCELIHDIFDEELVERNVIQHQPPDPTIYGEGEPMTTWHHDSAEGIWFAINSAYADKVDIATIVILDMTETGGVEIIKDILTKLASE